MKYRKILAGVVTANMLGMFTQSVASEGPPRIAPDKSGASAFFSDRHELCLNSAAGVPRQMIDCISEEREKLISAGQAILKFATSAPRANGIARALEDTGLDHSELASLTHEPQDSVPEDQTLPESPEPQERLNREIQTIIGAAST
jgi:hypothetical protein